MSANQELISVVMSVYNGAGTLGASLESVLHQRGVALECIVVNDGSTDHTSQVLARYAQADNRVRVLEQPNRGLTAALIRGCKAASGAFVARHDCGDRSSPHRLRVSLERLRDHPQAGLVSVGTRFEAEGEWLYDVCQSDEELMSALAMGRGPSHHGATLFRRDRYFLCGGYRRQFRYAQDLDLWLRLSEVAPALSIPELHYHALVDATGISALQRPSQVKLGALAFACAKARRAQGSEAHLLERAAVVSGLGGLEPEVGRLGPSLAFLQRRRSRARAHYFVGACLRHRKPSCARRSFQRALVEWPFHGAAFYRWLSTLVAFPKRESSKGESPRPESPRPESSRLESSRLESSRPASKGGG